MSWFKREKQDAPAVDKPADSERKVRTEGLWLKCEGCRQILWKQDLEANWNVCPKCGQHTAIEAAPRPSLLFDGAFDRLDTDLMSSDPLAFVDSKPYRERLSVTREATSLNDAVISAAGTLAGRRLNICAMESKFIG